MAPIVRPRRSSGTHIHERIPSVLQLARRAAPARATSDATSARVGVRVELRLAGAQDGGHADARVRVERMVAQAGEDVDVAAAACSTASRSIEPSSAAHVDHAPVAEPRHGEPRHLGERALVVERRREQLARLGEEAAAVLRALAPGDVVEDVDREPHAAVLVAHGRRADDRPAPARRSRGSGSRPSARAARSPGARAVPAARSSGSGSPSSSRSSKRAISSAIGAARSSVCGREADQARGRVVRVDEAAVRILDGDPVGDLAQDHRELVARLAQVLLDPGTVVHRRDRAQRCNVLGPDVSHRLMLSFPRSWAGCRSWRDDRSSGRGAG